MQSLGFLGTVAKTVVGKKQEKVAVQVAETVEVPTVQSFLSVSESVEPVPQSTSLVEEQVEVPTVQSVSELVEAAGGAGAAAVTQVLDDLLYASLPVPEPTVSSHTESSSE